MLPTGFKNRTRTRTTYATRRFSEEILLERQAKIGPRLFSLHYKLDTSLSDAQKYPLKLKDLLVTDLSPDLCLEKLVWSSSTSNKRVPSFGLAGDLIYEPMGF